MKKVKLTRVNKKTTKKSTKKTKPKPPPVCRCSKTKSIFSVEEKLEKPKPN